MRGHDIDVPITDLDDTADHIFGEPLEPLSDLDDFNLPSRRLVPLTRRTLYGRLRDTAKGWFYQKAPATREYYELQETYPCDSDLEGDDLAVVQGRTVDRLRPERMLLLIFGSFLILVFTFGLFSKRQEHPPSKPVLFNGTLLFYPTTLMISLDGMHPHYINTATTPHLHRLMKDGYGPPYMVPAFPLSTFPNHWTMVTGLDPSEHGIVGNTFWDAALNRQFVNTNALLLLDPRWWGGLSLWQTAETQGVRLAVHMWPGSEVVFATGNPLVVDRYNGLELLSQKASRILEWLDQDLATRPELILGYVPTIDTLGHRYGVSGNELRKGLEYVDTFIGMVVAGIEARNLTNIVNLIVVSDHGMAPTSNERLLFLDDMVDMDQIEHTDGWPLFGLRPYPGRFEAVYAALKRAEGSQSPFQVYRKEEMPEEWHFGRKERYPERVAPLWVVPNVGYSITTHAALKAKGGDYYPKGVHGYNNTEVLMRALFVAQGPFFTQRMGEVKKIRPFANKEVYNIVCDSLNVVQLPNNGTVVGEGSVFAVSNRLGQWQDPYSYPGVAFAMESLVDDATYDSLWRQAPDPVPQASPSTSPSVSLPGALPLVSSIPGPLRASASVPSTVSATARPGLAEHVGEVLTDLEEVVGDTAEKVGQALGGFWHKLTGHRVSNS